MSKHLEAKTMPEYFEKRYNSKPLKIVSALIVFVFLIPYTASVYNGLSRLFEKGFDIILVRLPKTFHASHEPMTAFPIPTHVEATP